MKDCSINNVNNEVGAYCFLSEHSIVALIMLIFRFLYCLFRL